MANIETKSIANEPQRLCLSVPEAARLLGISRGLGYELAQTGKLPIIRFGRRLLVPKAALDRMLNQGHAVER
ncbi:MAG: helix-turn-helix domain-containing protein [Chloroflexi bacterium]|nr:helix-turn-helix domain-containing protein [Chloroflexota bacterium]MBM3175912.1 helix-turn-helix domain-containing protein [Chloroflexota bacterium]MBM4450513.1 helix-turn-helix domain-containing protein [Chloroflexota bacterium]